MSYKPTDAFEHKYLELIISMTTDSLMGRGCETREAFTTNLRRIAGAIDDLHKPVDERGITVRHDE